MRGSRTSGSRSPPSDRGLALRGLDQDRVDHAILAGARCDPRESDLRLDRRAPRDDVPRHEVRIRRVRLHRDDLDFLRHGRAAIQDVGELRAQDAHLAVRPFCAVELQALSPDERVLLLSADRPPPFLAERPIAAARRLAFRSSLPEGHGSRPNRAGIYDPSAHARFRYPYARRFVSTKPRSAPPFSRGSPACGLPFRTNRMRKKNPARLPRTVPAATNALGSRPRNDRPGAVKNVNADTLMIPGMMRSPSPMNIASRSSPAST